MNTSTSPAIPQNAFAGPMDPAYNGCHVAASERRSSAKAGESWASPRLVHYDLGWSAPGRRSFESVLPHLPPHLA